MEMMKLTSINSIRLDKYYAVQKYVKFIETLFGKNVSIYVYIKEERNNKGSFGMETNVREVYE
ncbi:MAG: hypothetical protein KAQ84_06145 [Thermoplasmatales archaeon]|nr:hypothetical protein [Thermoplasmatales archaeon]